MKRSRALPTIAWTGLIAGITSAFVIVGITQHAVVSGLLYGIAVYMFMYWMVVPLAFPNARHSMSRDVTAVIIHIVLIGLPIALVVRRFSKEQLAES
jgi:uncharacterized membrane protein YagU involved in acid resistance